jgi:hypothetical protein
MNEIKQTDMKTTTNEKKKRQSQIETVSAIKCVLHHDYDDRDKLYRHSTLNCLC